MKKTKRYTVILQYPYYISQDEPETFTGWSQAPSAEKAIQNVRRQACRMNDTWFDGDEPDHKPEDFTVIAVYNGFLTGCKI